MGTTFTNLSRKIARFSYMLGIAGMVVAMLLTIIQQPASAEEFSQCGTGFEIKLEGTGPFTYTTSAGKIISQITLKAGQECVTFTSNGNDGCYNVSGLGSQTVSLTRVGDSKDCKEISHVLIHTTPGSKPTEEPKVTTTITKPPTEPPADTKTPTPVKTKTPPVTETPPVTKTPPPV
jgi:hypothetical protein